MIGEGTPVTIGLVVILVGALAALWVYFDRRMKEAEAKADAIAAEASARRAEIHRALDTLERDLADYKLHVERYFVPMATMEKTEERLINSIDKLSARVETLISRMEAVSVELGKLSAAAD